MDLRIAAFVTVSTLAHGGAALWLSDNPAPRLSLGGEARTLRVAVLPGRHATPGTPASRQTRTTPETTRQAPARRQQRAPEPPRHPPLPHTPVVTARADAVRAPSAAPPPAASPAPTTGKSGAAPPRSSAKNISRHISAALKNRLARYFEYPWLARQRGWQGRVLLSLHVASNGDLSDWKVVQTSGYRTLDQSALKAARRIERLPQAETWLRGQSLEVHLPVQYTLLDS